MLRQARRDFRATRAQILLCDARRIGEEILGGLGFAAVMVLLPMIAAVMAG